MIFKKIHNLCYEINSILWKHIYLLRVFKLKNKFRQFSIKDKKRFVKKKGLSRAHKCYQCYYCNTFFISEILQKRHINNCSGRPGVIYNFNNQNLVSYQGNFHVKGDVLLVVYFDYETTVPADNCLDPEQKKCLLFQM